VSRRRAGLRFDDGRDRRRRPHIIIGSTSSSTRRSSIRAVHIRGLVPHVPTRFQIRHSRVAVICRETFAVHFSVFFDVSVRPVRSVSGVPAAGTRSAIAM